MTLPPPSFSSFPDLNSANDPHEERVRDYGVANQRDTQEKGGSKKSRYESKRRQSHSKERSSRRAPRHEHSELMQPKEGKIHNYFSDRQGDRLNIEFGGLHVGNIPKYDLVAREQSFPSRPTSNQNKVERKFLAYQALG
jgi:hypothetical protein